MEFGKAITAIKSGKKVTRKNWKGEGTFLFLVPGSKFKVNRPPLLGIYPEGHEIAYRPHIDFRASGGTIGPWQPNHVDLLADDWVIVE